jgi:hypothetical protein
LLMPFGLFRVLSMLHLLCVANSHFIYIYI